MFKKLLSIFSFLALSFSISLHAQEVERHIDLEILQTKYAPNELIPYGDTFVIMISIVNHGPDDLLQGDYVKVVDDLSFFSIYHSSGIAVGDTATFETLSCINLRDEDEVLDACIWLGFSENIQDNDHILIDNNQQNDTFCFSVLLEGENTNSIKENNASSDFVIYPNPIKAQQSLFIKLQDDQGPMPKYVRVINILGARGISINYGE